MSERPWTHHDAGDWKIRARPCRPEIPHAWIAEAKRKADGPWAEHALLERLDFEIHFEFGDTEADVVAKLRREVGN